MSERFTRAIDALVKAYLNNTLTKGICTRCAVGNIVAAGYASVGRFEPCSYWGVLFSTNQDGKQRRMNWKIVKSTIDFFGFTESQILDVANDNVQVTGYSEEELARVEYAFETNTTYDFNGVFSKEQRDQDQYNGLMAVVDVLCDIEGISDPAEYKFMFNKQLA